jgi:RNA polymerase sigma-70 factor (ECF subfamily)
MMALKDCDLLKLVEGGNQQALVAIYDRYSGLAYSVAVRLLKDPAAAEDVLQELFMQLWRNPQQIKLLDKTLYGWMVIASRNRSISVLRKRRPESLADLILTSSFNLERHLEQRLMCEKLINNLSPEQRVVMEMAYLGEMSHSEIASATGYPLGTIKTRIRSALALLRQSAVLGRESLPSSESAMSAMHF